MTQRQRLQELLVQLSYEKKSVTLASGQKSDFYFDAKQTSLHPEGITLLGHLLLQKIQESYPDARAVGGPTLGADPLVSAISYTSFLQKKPIPAFILRKEPKKHGTQAWIEGYRNLAPGMNVVVVEDVLTTGGSAIKAIDKTIEGGLKVVGVLTVIDREEGGAEAIQRKGYRVESLFTKTELLVTS